ncbi:esterase family protein [Nocardia higoensis]|uniref:Esterase family protein n=1 Tax=Nocardia higoensis TaxID=228599 RepID=A0ABS0D6G9_9NOCA|nr:esterase family protein [Nocardia higoensis]
MLVALTAVVGTALGAGGYAVAGPTDTVASAARISRTTVLDSGRDYELDVYSAAMDTDVRVRVRAAADRRIPAPTVYLLNGISGGDDGGNWFEKTDVTTFLEDEQVTLVMPLGGEASYYADWHAEDPALGTQRWATFLTRELPPLVDDAFHGNGANAIAGISMAGTSVFQLALGAPGLYRAIGAYSGCARTSDARGRAIVNTVVRIRGGDPANLWGPPEDPRWAANDPYLRVEELRGTAVYLSAGSGLPGEHDTLDAPGTEGDLRKFADQLVIGGALEAIAADCARQLSDRLLESGIPATLELRRGGTHTWAYWAEDFRRSWPLLAAALTAD